MGEAKKGFKKTKRATYAANGSKRRRGKIIGQLIYFDDALEKEKSIAGKLG